MSSITRERPSLDQWLKEAKAEETAGQCGMYLVHNGTVRETARAQVRQGQDRQIGRASCRERV